MSNDGDVSGFHGVPGDLDYGHDIWVFKTDKQGNLIWQNCLGGLYSEFARNIFPTTDGGYMIIGTTQSDDGDVEGFNGGDTGGYDDIWFAKIDSLGQLTWQYCYGGFGTEYLYRGVYQKGDYDYVLTLGTKTDNWQCNINTAKPDLRIVELYDSTVGINENNPESSGDNLKVEVSPNPAKDKISFKYSLPSNQSKAQLTIYSNTGQIIRSFNIMANQGQIIYNTSGLNAGVYLYSVVAGKENKKGKFVNR
ncbi:MAG: T9SS type A sorting domain-containing protein [Chlorobi bacterium]|nr:T9SS type A sorting domain-containing protein [Chlorobiota bacterium]